MKTQKMLLLFGVALVAAMAVPTVLASSYGNWGGGTPPYGAYWGYNFGWNNYISPPVYLSYRGGDNCVIGVRSSYWAGFPECSGYGYNAVREWNRDPYAYTRYQGPTRYSYGSPGYGSTYGRGY